jgi:methylated-DNA-[protein]-cysteine S-methyltransferase
MTTRELRAGPLAVTVTLAGETLRRVVLPRRIPDDLNATHLAKLLEQMGQFHLDLREAPPFHRKVWEQLRRIPWGSARTYQEIARAAGSPRASRAAGQACAANRLPLIIPCHRVVAQAGLGGFAFGLPWKRKLLELEAAE